MKPSQTRVTTMLCRECREPLPEKSRSTRAFCSDAHRVAWHRRQNGDSSSTADRAERREARRWFWEQMKGATHSINPKQIAGLSLWDLAALDFIVKRWIKSGKNFPGLDFNADYSVISIMVDAFGPYPSDWPTDPGDIPLTSTVEQ